MMDYVDEKPDVSNDMLEDTLDTEIPDAVNEEDQECEILDAPETNSKYNEILDRYRRSMAEFDNYRKRTTKEMSARYDDGIRAACEKLLPLVDNFERALSAHENKDDSFYQGVAMIARQFGNIYGELGILAIELNPGDQFDPNFHNAVAHVEDENFGQNEVAEILQKGYIHKDKVIRHSMVRVAN